jgi:hypothetical protein
MVMFYFFWLFGVRLNTSKRVGGGGSVLVRISANRALGILQLAFFGTPVEEN